MGNNRRNLNFVFWPVTLCTDCESHKGFWRNFISLRPEITTLIEIMGNTLASIDGASTKFLTTGMSMGAPLASLTAYHLSNLGHTAMGVVTFGSPRAGNSKLAEAITGSFLSEGVGTVGIAYMRDPVPHVPPRVLGYRSAQSLLFHIAIDPIASIKAEMGESVDLESYVLYRTFTRAPQTTPGKATSSLPEPRTHTSCPTTSATFFQPHSVLTCTHAGRRVRISSITTRRQSC